MRLSPDSIGSILPLVEFAHVDLATGAAAPLPIGAFVRVGRGKFVPALTVRRCASRAAIARLNIPGSPDTICGLIAAIVVLTLYGVLRRWARPHVGQECGELLPSRAHSDPASAIIR